MSSGGQSISLYPPKDTAVAFDSSENVTYTCEISSATDGESALLWDVNGTQIWSQSQIDHYDKSGVFIENKNGSITLLMSPEGRLLLANKDPIAIKCSSYDAGELLIKVHEQSQLVHIRQFGKRCSSWYKAWTQHSV